MLIACALAAATLGASTIPPINIRIHASPAISRELVMLTLAEANMIYGDAGLRIAWRFDRGPGVDVTFDETPGGDDHGNMALGWIPFDSGLPEPHVHLSYANALVLIEEAEGRSSLARMTMLERHTLLARALGRALAHELGHYLLASKEHTRDGLMRAKRTASDFMSPFRSGFGLSSAQQTVIASRLMTGDLLASRDDSR